MKTFAFITILAAVFTSFTFAAPDPNFHIYLAFGQSNMEGNGQIESQDRTVDKRFQMLSTVGGCNNRQLGQWYDATPPLSNCNGKLSMVDYFGRNMVKNLPEQIKVGVVVVAVAGCDIQLFEKDNYRSYNQPDWMRGIVQQYGGNPYGRLIDMAKKAQEVGVIKGILLHQGETNSGQQNWPNRVKGIYDNILKDLGLNANDVPLLAGELVQQSLGGSCGGHNSIIQKLPSVIPTAHVISSQGLNHVGDGLHFSSASYRTFGQRYADEMLKILGDVKVVSSGGQTQGGQTQGGQTQGGQTQGGQTQGGQTQGGQGNFGFNFPGFGGNTQPQTQTCWSQSLGFPCCSGNNAVLYTDQSGQWGVQNGNWCGLRQASNTCWASKLGFKCCSTGACRNVQYYDTDGQWDVENGNWCGISFSNTIC